MARFQPMIFSNKKSNVIQRSLSHKNTKKHGFIHFSFNKQRCTVIYLTFTIYQNLFNKSIFFIRTVISINIKLCV